MTNRRHTLDSLAETIAIRAKADRSQSHTADLVKRGKGFVCQKVVEEAGETAVAAMGEGNQRLVEESSDLLYHLMVLWHVSGIKAEQIWRCLEERAKPK